MHVAAVIDRAFSFETFQAISSQDEIELLGNLEELTFHRFLSRESNDDYRLFHSLVGSAIRRDLREDCRKRLHRAAADGLCRIQGDDGTLAAEIAEHYLQADEDNLAWPFLVQAGKQAFDAYA